jgi:hypothetical protein
VKIVDPGADQLWAAEELSVSGEYIRARIKGVSYRPIDRTIEKLQQFHKVLVPIFGGQIQQMLELKQMILYYRKTAHINQY